ncbi:MAG: hypothetical protein CMN76_18190 [Spirochaetaceae bacterium]|nr:hypothetical protein [Spirochaetaceae bacterium]|tara:strand:+ start:212902 stop:213720 length:819 start_codon:yes stop_codon:yes gene_type:complete
MKVTVFCDLTETSETFFQSLANWIPSQCEQVTLVHCLESMLPPGSPMEAHGNHIAELKSRKYSELQALCEKLPYSTHIRVAEKSPPEVIKEESRLQLNRKSDLIIFGLYRKSSVERILTGTTGEGIINESKVPCLGLPVEKSSEFMHTWMLALRSTDPLNEPALISLTQLYKERLKRIAAVSILSGPGAPEAWDRQLAELCARLPVDASYEILHSDDPATRLQEFASEPQSSPVILQRRKRTWKEEVFGPVLSRSFLFGAGQPVFFLPQVHQ